MLTFSGAPALSDFRLEKVLAAVRERVAHVESVDTRYLHFVDARAPLVADEQRAVARGAAALRSVDPDDGRRVHPRASCCWSCRASAPSRRGRRKATDIAHVCGLGSRRAASSAASPTSSMVAQPLTRGRAARRSAAVLHDRMTEGVLDSIDGRSGPVRARSAAAAATVPVLAQGRAALERRQCRTRARAVRRRDRLPGRRVPRSCGAIRPTSS